MTIRQLHNNQKFELLTQIWPGMLRADFDTYAPLYEKYYLYLDDQLSSVQQKPTVYTAHTIRGLGDVIHSIRGSDNKAKADVTADQSQASYNTIDIAVRMWLTIHVQHSNTQSLECFHWPENKTLSNALEEWFDQSISSKRHLNDNNVRQIPQAFSIPNLIQYYEMKVIWTSDLLQHLKVDWAHNQIKVYEHGICLRNHMQNPDFCPLPKEVVREAVDTLTLLFPRGRDTDDLLLKERRTILDVPYGRSRILALSNYHYWRPTLSELITHWEKGPKGLSQIRLKPDHGNLMEYVTFWVATLVLILTILSIAFGVASLVLAKKALDVSIRSLDVSVQSYNLALAIACAEKNATETLPSFFSATPKEEKEEEPTDQPESSSSPSGAIIGGAVAGGVVGMAVICLGIFFVLRQRRKSRAEERSHPTDVHVRDDKGDFSAWYPPQEMAGSKPMPAEIQGQSHFV